MKKNQNQENKEQKGKEKKGKEKKEQDKKEQKEAPKIDLPLPEFVQHRLKVFDEWKSKNPPKEIPAKEINIKLLDGKVVKGISGKTTPHDIALGISKGLADSSVVAKVNDQLHDLFRPIEEDCSLEFIKFDSPEGKHVFWHSSAHILGEALERVYGAKLAVGPALEEGFYYDSRVDNPISETDFPKIEAVIQQILNEKQSFERITVPKEVALEMFKYNPYKHSILAQKVPEGGTCNVYRCGTLLDPCKGPHIFNSARVKAMKLTKLSSSYWQGKAENDSLQRVYGISFPDPKQLKEWEIIQVEAAKRDHRNVGKVQELFFFHPLSPGSCFFLPHGTRIYNKLIEFLRGEYRKRGFSEVITPNMYNHQLWVTSGHWQNYQENMFTFKVEEQHFALKPMNCPGHCLMFAHRLRSYKELPLRFADFGVLHRNELSGALTGLTRVRRFQQDDAHIFCTVGQIKAEISGALDFMKYVYQIFGYEFKLELSTRPEKYLGEIEVWNNAERQLELVLNEFKEQTGSHWKLNPGDGAFYGPKIDIHISDALKRSHQCATIQLDFQLPIRFNLEYQDETDKNTRPVIIHRAILGSVERMIAILIEHTGGKWPFWLSPRQAVVLPVSEKTMNYAEEIRQFLWDQGFYVDCDASDDLLSKKIRNAQLSQYNFILVVGEKEMQERSVNIRTRDGVQHGVRSLEELLEEFKWLDKNKK